MWWRGGKRFASFPHRPAGRRPSAAQAWLGPSRRARFRDDLGWVGSAAVVVIGLDFEIKFVSRGWPDAWEVSCSVSCCGILDEGDRSWTSPGRDAMGRETWSWMAAAQKGGMRCCSCNDMRLEPVKPEQFVVICPRAVVPVSLPGAELAAG